MWVSQLSENNLNEELIDRVLFDGIEDTGENVDCIVVLGSIKAARYRVPVAVNAYDQGRADKIMLCGGAIRKFPEGKYRECDSMAKKAIELGVPQENIILESFSQNTIENMLFIMVELQRHFWLNNVQKVLLVTTSYHMRRSLALARYLFPKHIKIIPCPADDNNTKRDNWMKSSEGTARAKAEVLKLMKCVENGLIPDFKF